MANLNTQSIWTYTLTDDTLVIDDTFSLTVLSVLVTAGTATILGSMTASVASQAVGLAEGQGLTISSGENSRNCLNGITIIVPNGSVAILSGR